MLTVAFASSTVAQTIYTFSGTGNWTDTANWSPSVPPAVFGANNLVVASDSKLTINTDVIFEGSVQILSNSEVIISETSSVEIAATSTSRLSLRFSAEMINNGVFEINTQSTILSVIAGTFENNGTVKLGSRLIIGSSNINNPGGTFINNETALFQNLSSANNFDKLSIDDEAKFLNYGRFENFKNLEVKGPVGTEFINYNFFDNKGFVSNTATFTLRPEAVIDNNSGGVFQNVRIFNNDGTFINNSNLRQSVDAISELHITSPTEFSSLQFTELVSTINFSFIDGALQIKVDESANLAIGDKITIPTNGLNGNGTFTSVDVINKLATFSIVYNLNNFELTVTSLTPGAVAPTMPEILEDASAVALGDDIQIGDLNGNDQTVTFTISGGILTLGTTDIIFGGDGNGSSSFTAQGNLTAINNALDNATFTPEPNFNGTASISFVSNNGSIDSNTAQVNFNIVPVNDAPVFELLFNASRTVREDLPVQYSLVARDINDGDDDVRQNVTFNILSNDNPSLFTIQPTIDSTGQLMFQSAPNKNGTANITFNLSDDGGTANGGEDTSVQQTFFIRILQDNDVFWDGDTDASWGDHTNWENNRFPHSAIDIVIPNTINQPIIESGFTRTMNSLTLENSTSLNINSAGAAIVNGDFDNSGIVNIKSGNFGSGVLIVKGTANGLVTYERDRLKANEWSIISAPVVGQSIKEFVENPANDIRINMAVTPNRYAVAYYDDSKPAGSKWVYYTTTDLETNTITFEKGRGYIVSRNTDGSVTFTGTLETGNVRKSLEENKWNAIGNPYTALLPGNQNSANFIIDNLNDFDPAYVAFYTWDNNQNKYVANLRTTASKSIVPGQGFFVKTGIGRTSMIFAEVRRNTQALLGGLFSREIENHGFELSATSNNKTVKTNIYFNENASLGLDPGQDAGNFDSANFDLFTRLVNSSSDTNFTIQSLPDSDYKDLVIPVGVKAKAGTEIIFTIESLNLPKDVEVYLEDKATKTVTKFDTKRTGAFTKYNTSSSYKAKLDTDTNGVGRFYLHTKYSVLDISDLSLESVKIYNTKSDLIIEGMQGEQFEVSIFNTLGKVIQQTTKESIGKNVIQLPEVETGVYIVRLSTENGIKNKKIIINK